MSQTKKRRMIAKTKVLSKQELAKQLGISCSSLYYWLKMPAKDWRFKNQIELVFKDHPGYSYRRVALVLGINHKSTFRVMRGFGIKPYWRRGKKFKKTKDSANIYPNLLQLIPFPNRANMAWVSDFTQWPFHGRIIYLATIMDIFNRKIIGRSLLNSHTIQLTLTTLMKAIEKYTVGLKFSIRIKAQNTRAEHTPVLLPVLGIRLSMSKKGSPWENDY